MSKKSSFLSSIGLVVLLTALTACRKNVENTAKTDFLKEETAAGVITTKADTSEIPFFQENKETEARKPIEEYQDCRAAEEIGYCRYSVLVQEGRTPDLQEKPAPSEWDTSYEVFTFAGEPLICKGDELILF